MCINQFPQLIKYGISFSIKDLLVPHIKKGVKKINQKLISWNINKS